MKPALQAILVGPNPEMRQRILDGRKKITLREGHRDYKPGKVMLCDHKALWVVEAEITNVRHTTLREVTEEEYKADGFVNRKNLLTGMKHYYPTMTLDSPVTVITWDKVEGCLLSVLNRKNRP